MSNYTNERYVLVFDICSSTLIFEDLQRNNRLPEYWNLVNDIRSFLSDNKSFFKYEIYKFLGDGFILIFNEETIIDQILLFMIRLADDCNDILKKFIKDRLDRIELPRIGITIGLDKGVLYEQNVDDKNVEYIGTPLNKAMRLQSSLKEIEHTNKCLMSRIVYNEISNTNFKKICSETTRTFRNMASEERIKCYEFAPLFYESADISHLMESKRKLIKDYIVQNEPIKKEFEIIHANATEKIENIDKIIRDYIHQEFLKWTTPQLNDALKIAQDELWVIGQNLFFIANPSRRTREEMPEDYFHDLLFKRIKVNPNFKIRLLIFNPLAKNLIVEWHNKIIRNWENTAENERSPGHKEKPNFIADLKFSFEKFKKWQNEVKNRNLSITNLNDLPILIKCTSERVDSANIVDPLRYGVIDVTHPYEAAIADTMSRAKYGKKYFYKNDQAKLWVSKMRQYRQLFDKATYILEINNVNWYDLYKLSTESLS